MARAGRAPGARVFDDGRHRRYVLEHADGDQRGFGCGEAEQRSRQIEVEDQAIAFRGGGSARIVSPARMVVQAESTSPESRHTRDSLRNWASGNGGWRSGRAASEPIGAETGHTA